MGNTQKELLEGYKQWMKIERGNGKITIRNGIAFSRRFLKWLKSNNVDIENIDQETINRYLLYCHQKYARNTLIPITINLRKLCCHFLGKDLKIKVATAKASNRDKTSLTKKEVEAIFDVSKGHPLETAVLKTLYYTGVRESELINLDITDVDFDRLQITIRHGKGDRSRTVNITKSCAVAIQRWLQVRPKPKEGHENALFISRFSRRISVFYLWNLVKKAAANAGITKNVYPHKFRITMITHMAEAGLSPREIQVQSGHRDITTLVGYIQHSPSRIRQSYERVFGDVKSLDRKPDKGEVIVDNEQYKKMAVKKYLMGEIDSDTLHSILTTIEEKKQEKKSTIDPSYV